MREITLTHGQVTCVDDADFEWLSQWKWEAKPEHQKYYAYRRWRVGGGIRKSVRMHKLIMGTPKGMHTDHKDGDSLNNQRSNLRVCTSAQNGANRGKSRVSTSGYKGVYWFKPISQWMAAIGANGTNVFLGYFKDRIDAAKAYDAAALNLHGEFAHLNFPPQS